MRPRPIHLHDYEGGEYYAFGVCGSRADRSRVTKDPKLVTCKSCLRTNRYKKAIQ